MDKKPTNVGIKAIDLYFPNLCVDQGELEMYDSVSPGKHTIGLGQSKMSFCDDREDIYSIALTAVSSLLRKFDISPNSIGRLEVGTETLLDKSKSIKTVLMRLFEQNHNIEGVDTINACYGGTNALFNAINWVESSAWDGRDAIVVAGDIAIYKKGVARPTGGAGCVAMLIGPDAPLVFEPGLRGSYFADVYDFYKPDFSTEYPVVDGKFSITCYLRALDHCYAQYKLREAKLSEQLADRLTNGKIKEHVYPMDRFDFFCFHTPMQKMAIKAYARLLYNDIIANPTNPVFAEIMKSLPDIDNEASLTDRTLDYTLRALTSERFNQRVKPSTLVPSLCGNMYTGSVYCGLCSLLCNTPSSNLLGKRVALFSYGSGLASSLLSLKVVGSVQGIQDRLNINERLDSRLMLSPQEYEEILSLREKAYQKRNYTPEGDVQRLLPNTYYLIKVDDLFRRHYAIKE